MDGHLRFGQITAIEMAIPPGCEDKRVLVHFAGTQAYLKPADPLERQVGRWLGQWVHVIVGDYHGVKTIRKMVVEDDAYRELLEWSLSDDNPKSATQVLLKVPAIRDRVNRLMGRKSVGKGDSETFFTFLRTFFRRRIRGL